MYCDCTWLVNYDECALHGGTCDSCMCDEYEKDENTIDPAEYEDMAKNW